MKRSPRPAVAAHRDATHWGTSQLWQHLQLIAGLSRATPDRNSVSVSSSAVAWSSLCAEAGCKAVACSAVVSLHYSVIMLLETC